MQFKTAVILILTVLVSIVILQNSEAVTLRLLFWEFSLSQIILIPIILLIGFIIGFFVGRKSWDW